MATFILYKLLWIIHLSLPLSKSEVLWYHPMNGPISFEWSISTGSVIPTTNNPNCPQSTRYCWQGYSAAKNDDWSITRDTQITTNYNNIVFSYQLSTSLTAFNTFCLIEYSTNGGVDWAFIENINGQNVDIAGNFTTWNTTNPSTIQIRVQSIDINTHGLRYCWFNEFKLTGDLPTSSPTSVSPTTQTPTTSNPTSASPTTSNPTTSQPTTTSNPTTQTPTTSMPTTSIPSTSLPTILPSQPTQNPISTLKPSQRPTRSPTAPTTPFPTLNPSIPSISPTTTPTTATPTTSPGAGPVPVDLSTTLDDTDNQGDEGGKSLSAFTGSTNGILVIIGIVILLLICIIIITLFMLKRMNNSDKDTQGLRHSIDKHHMMAMASKSYDTGLQMTGADMHTNTHTHMHTNEQPKPSEYHMHTGNAYHNNDSDDEVLITTGNVTMGGPDMHIEDDYKEDIDHELETGSGGDGSNSDDDVLMTGHVTMGGPDIEIVDDDYKGDISGDGSEAYDDDDGVIHIDGNTCRSREDVQLGFGDDDSDNDVLINTGGHVTMGAPPVTNVPDDDDSDNIYILGAHVTLGGPQHSSEDDENVPPPPLPPTEYIQENDSENGDDDDDDVLDGIPTLR